VAEHEPHDPPACDAALVRAFSFLGKRWSGVVIGSLTVNEGPPVSVTYELTATGRGLIPALNALSQWANESLPATDR
jgi:DNA-binding HxlR family transcriptional regulator